MNVDRFVTLIRAASFSFSPYLQAAAINSGLLEPELWSMLHTSATCFESYGLLQAFQLPVLQLRSQLESFQL